MRIFLRRVLLLAVLACVRAGRATDFVWSNPAGGGYQESANWTPSGGPPGAADRAVLAGTPSGPIVLGANITNHTLSVAVDSGPLTLDLGGNLLELLNIDRSSTYTNWGWVCGAGSSLVVTSTVSGGLVDGLDERLDASSFCSVALFIDAGAKLNVHGGDTTLKLLQARVAGGQWRITGGADVDLGHNYERGTSTYIGTNPDAAVLIVDGAGTTYDDVNRYVQNGTMVITNGASANNLFPVYFGSDGSTGRVVVAGNGAAMRGAYAFFGGANGQGTAIVADGCKLANSSYIACADHAFGQVLITGSGSRYGGESGSFLWICDGAYTGATGLLWVADSALVYMRWFRMKTGGTIRFDNGTMQLVWGNTTDQLTYNRGGRIEGVGTLKNSAAGGEETFENDAGGVIAPGLAIGTLTFDGWGRAAEGVGAFTNGPGGIIEMEIAGVDNYDRLIFSNGRVRLGGGTLRLVLANGYRPSRRTTYQILDWSAGGSLGGKFDTVELPSNDRWLLDRLYTDGTVTVEPTKGSVILVR